MIFLRKIILKIWTCTIRKALLINFIFFKHTIIYNTFVTVLHCASEKKNSALFCPPVPALWPMYWNTTPGFVVVYSVETGTLWPWLIGLLYRSLFLWNNSDCLDPHCQHINRSVSWIHQGHHSMADAFLASRWTTAGPVSSASLFHLTGTRPVPSMQRFFPPPVELFERCVNLAKHRNVPNKSWSLW